MRTPSCSCALSYVVVATLLLAGLVCTALATECEGGMRVGASSTLDNAVVMAEENVWYFAYGSNLRRARVVRRLEDGLVANVDPIVAELPGWFLTFNVGASDGDMGYANIETDPEVKLSEDQPSVIGLLWKLTPKGIESMDGFEGVHANCYKRETVTVTSVATSEQIVAETYIFDSNRPRYKKGLLPSQGYMDHLLAGEADGIPTDYIAWLNTLPVNTDCVETNVEPEEGTAEAAGEW